MPPRGVGLQRTVCLLSEAESVLRLRLFKPNPIARCVLRGGQSKCGSKKRKTEGREIELLRSRRFAFLRALCVLCVLGFLPVVFSPVSRVRLALWRRVARVAIRSRLGGW